jgi:hypothetical protein
LSIYKRRGTRTKTPSLSTLQTTSSSNQTIRPSARLGPPTALDPLQPAPYLGHEATKCQRLQFCCTADPAPRERDCQGRPRGLGIAGTWDDADRRGAEEVGDAWQELWGSVEKWAHRRPDNCPNPPVKGLVGIGRRGSKG